MISLNICKCDPANLWPHTQILLAANLEIINLTEEKKHNSDYACNIATQKLILS